MTDWKGGFSLPQESIDRRYRNITPVQGLMSDMSVIQLAGEFGVGVLPARAVFPGDGSQSGSKLPLLLLLKDRAWYDRRIEENQSRGKTTKSDNIHQIGF